MIELRRRYSGGGGSDAPSFSRLPAGYQEVEYIENTFRAVLLIPIPNVEYFDSIKYKFYLSAEQTQQTNTLYSTPSASGNNCMILRSSYLGGVIRWFNYTSNSKQLLPLSKGNYYEEEIRYPIMISNTSQINLTTDSDKLYNENIVIFAANYGGGYIENGNGRLYYFTIEGKINLVPCYRISDRKPGVYDIVNDVFYTNAGEGEFLVGPDVHYNIPPEYQQVEYLESDGNSYLEIPFDNVRYDDRIKFGFKATNASLQHIFGSSFVNGNVTMVAMYYVGGENTSIFRWFIYQTRNNMIDIRTYNKYDVEVQYPTLRMENNNTQSVTEYQLYQITSETLYSNDFTLFTAIFNGKPNGTFKNGQIFYFEVEGKINLIPCFRKADYAAGMYDVFNGVFYTNAGTGEFFLGPDVIG